MNRPLTLHLKAALLCGFLGIIIALPLLWVPLLPAWQGWRPPIVNPRVEAILASVMAFWVAWCVVDIPRGGLKVLVWGATLWLLGSGIWLFGLYGYDSSSLVPLTAAAVAGIAALIFSITPAGSRRVRWQSLVGGRVAPAFLRARVDEQRLDEEPRRETLTVLEVLWPGGGDEVATWGGMTGVAEEAARYFQEQGGYLERCDAGGACFVFGCWGQTVELSSLVQAAWNWVRKAGGCVAITRGECVSGAADFPSGKRWTVGGVSPRKATRMASAARGSAARLLVEDSLAKELAGAWIARRMAWWDFEGERILLHEINSPVEGAPPEVSADVARWDRAWDAFWRGHWVEAENGFASLARERDDAAARIFALRSAAARRHDEDL